MIGLLIAPAASAGELWTEDARIVPSSSFTDHDFGRSLSIAGDLDGDGASEIVIGAPGDGDDGVAAGAAYVYAGGGGLLAKLTASDGIQASGYGRAVSSGGDLDGDGLDDVAVGAWYRASTAHGSAGAAYVYSGSAGGVDSASEIILTAPDPGSTHYFGFSVSVEGDLDGDGYADLAVSAPRAREYAGQVYLYEGGAGGIDPASPSILYASDGVPFDLYGGVLKSGDLDGDGTADLIVSAYYAGFAAQQAGAVYAYLGSSGGVDPSTEQRLVPGDLDDLDTFGIGVAITDLNSDGMDDLIVGSPRADSTVRDVGAVYTYLGSSAGLEASSEQKTVPGALNSGDVMGYALAGAGDVNGDGYGDVVVGVIGYDSAHDSAGRAYLLPGTADGLGSSTVAILEAGTPTAEARFGSAVAAGADVDGDGGADIVVGAPEDSLVLADAGAVFVFYGEVVDADGDGVAAGLDCDDADPEVGAPIDGYLDADGDGYGDPGAPAEACPGSAGFAAVAGDCDDSDSATSPGAEEVCGDGVDSDCDGSDDSDDCAIGGDDEPAGDDSDAVGGKEDGGCSALPAGTGLGGMLLAVLGARRRRRPSV